MMRDHGQAKKYYHDMEGYNGRLDAIQAGHSECEVEASAGVERAAAGAGRGIQAAVCRHRGRAQGAL